MRRRRRFFLILLRVLLTLVLASGVYAALQLKNIADDVRAESSLRTTLRESVFVLPAAAPADGDAHECPVDFTALRESCPGAVAWLSGCGGAIDTPVVQGQDNIYYLDHLADGTPNLLGAAFLDQNNAPRFSDDQSFIFGHCSGDGGGVFAPLLSYRDAGFLSEHPAFTLHTPHGCFRAEVFAAFSAGEDEYPYICEFPHAGDWLRFTQFLRPYARTAETPLTPGDRVLTLGTCTPDGGARFVVCSKLSPL